MAPIIPSFLSLMIFFFKPFPNSMQLLVTSQQSKVRESLVSVLLIPSSFQICFCMASVSMAVSGPFWQVAQCPTPHPFLCHELNHPAHDLPPTSVSQSGGGNDSHSLAKPHNDSCITIHLPTHCSLPAPLSFLANLGSVEHARRCKTWHQRWLWCLYGTDI